MKRKREETICVYGADCIFPHCEFSHEKHHNNILCPKEYRHIYNKYMDYIKCEDKACTFAHEKSTEKCKFGLNCRNMKFCNHVHKFEPISQTIFHSKCTDWINDQFWKKNTSVDFQYQKIECSLKYREKHYNSIQNFINDKTVFPCVDLITKTQIGIYYLYGSSASMQLQLIHNIIPFQINKNKYEDLVLLSCLTEFRNIILNID